MTIEQSKWTLPEHMFPHRVEWILSSNDCTGYVLRWMLDNIDRKDFDYSVEALGDVNQMKSQQQKLLMMLRHSEDAELLSNNLARILVILKLTYGADIADVK